MNYKNAFKCKRCPKSNKEDGCPAWNEVIMTNPATGEQKIEAGCHFQMMPALLVEGIKATNLAANTHAGVKTEVARGFSLLAQSMPGLVSAMAEQVGPGEEVQLLGDGEEETS